MSIFKNAAEKLKNILGFQKKNPGSLGEGYDPALVRFFMSDEFHQLEKKYNAFKALLSHNNAVLNLMSELQERVASQLITLPYFNKEVIHLLEKMDTFIQALNALSKSKYRWLEEVLEGIQKEIMETLKDPMVSQSLMVYPLDTLSSIMAAEVGSKAANLGEVRNILHIPTPDGFAISSVCYSNMISESGISKLIDILIGEIRSEEDEEGISNASKRLQEAILNAAIPKEMEDAIHQGLKRFDEDTIFAVRSSAIGEDGKFSFAGQFRSLLGVHKDGILDAYKKVCASLYEERAIRYRLTNKMPQDHSIAMGVLVLELVRAKSAGVLYTLNPVEPDSDEMFVSAVRGLGISAVDGSVAPDTYHLERKSSGKVAREEIAPKETEISIDNKGGVKEAPVNPDEPLKPCLDPETLHRLFDIGMVIEKHFGVPQDIEWAVDSSGWIYVLQARPLLMARQLSCTFPELDKSPLLTGTPVSPGACSGPVFIAEKKSQSIPRGAVLVVKTMDPEFAKFIPSVAGLIAETGSPATHLASVSREFHRPAIVNAKNATTLFKNGEMITLDANQGRVFKGYIESLIKMRLCQEETSLTDNRNMPFMKRVMRNILPLNLTKLQDNVALEVAVKKEDFKTIHDIIRFIHEASVREMFQLEAKGESVAAHKLIDQRVPLVFYIIDIEGGLSPKAVFKRKVSVSEIQSRPFLKLWEGMTHDGVSWTGPVQFDLGGFFSVMSRSFVEGNVSETGGKAYVIISRDYLNFHCRLAYHFTVIDSVCGQDPASNYITFRFEGGGAGADGRMRRILLLNDILEELYFRVEIKGDFLTAVFRGGSLQDTEVKLKQLGKLIAFTRQLDMTLTDDDTRQRYVEAFLKGSAGTVQEENKD